MKHGTFISSLAKILCLDAAAVRQIARVIREAGHLTTGPRGVNAPDMSHLDSARMLLALLTGEPPSRVVAAYNLLATQVPLPDFDEEPLLQQERFNGTKINSLEGHLVWVLKELSEPAPSKLLLVGGPRSETVPRASITVRHKQKDAEMVIGGKRIGFVQPKIAELFTGGSIPTGESARLAWPDEPFGMQIQRSISTNELTSIAKAVGLESNKKPTGFQ